MKKRILSILLTLCMVLCIVSTSVFAEDNMAASGTAEVSTAAELVSAIREASYGTVKLTSDITIYTTLVVNRTVTLPAWLNAAALERNVNFSQVLQDALRTQLHL